MRAVKFFLVDNRIAEINKPAANKFEVLRFSFLVLGQWLMTNR
jgi:hypothetical protein